MSYKELCQQYLAKKKILLNIPSGKEGYVRLQKELELIYDKIKEIQDSIPRSTAGEGSYTPELTGCSMYYKKYLKDNK